MGSCFSVRIKAESPLHHGMFFCLVFHFFNANLSFVISGGLLFFFPFPGSFF